MTAIDGILAENRPNYEKITIAVGVIVLHERLLSALWVVVDFYRAGMKIEEGFSDNLNTHCGWQICLTKAGFNQNTGQYIY